MRLSLIAVAFCLLIAPAAAEDLSCDGPIKHDATHAKLVALYGKANVVAGKLPGPEGTEIVGSVIFPKDRARKLSVIWADEKKRAQPTNVSPAGPGWTIAGLTRKSSLADVEKANGRPFAIAGFGWDYGGYVTDWKGGALDTLKTGKCSVSIRLAVADDKLEKAPKALLGDGVTILSNDRRLAGLGIYVVDLSIGFPTE